ncbi:MAG: HAD-IA family hydrolase [Bacteroidales bacterium]|jgi:putative hydrolase of the HAD superfamily|nr:HAD-IA family hydrolase [Bacteroidales bacterium]
MIKNIIFDLCGPIITIDLNLLNNKLFEYGVKDIDNPYKKLYKEGVTKEFEKNLISPEEFCDKVRKVLNTPLTDVQIISAWNTLITDAPKEHATLLKRLSKKYNLFLLSNSDVINAQFFRKYVDTELGSELFASTFKRVFFSCDLKLRKPEPAVFQTILVKEKLKASETLLIDDCKKHTEGATFAGLNTIWLQKGTDISELFDSKGNIIYTATSPLM